MLSDKEILELNELCNALIDGRVTTAQQARLSQWLAASADARQFYVRALGLSASLGHYAAEMQSDEMETPAGTGTKIVAAWWLAGLAAAACVMFAVMFHRGGKANQEAAKPKAEELVARLTASKGCQWSGDVVRPNEGLARGRRLELSSGLAEITFDSGARVVMEGPAALNIDSAWDATLLRGALNVNVPPEAIGFTISNPSVEVVDLGTEFTMIGDGKGSAEVLVLKGAVEATSRETADEETIVLRETEARRFTAAGVTDVHDSARKFARFTEAAGLERFLPATEYVHWSFDENDGNIFTAEAGGARLESRNAVFYSEGSAPQTAPRVEGKRQLALQLDGHSFAKAPFPGISEGASHTVVFWVQIPQDALLSEAYAIVAWNTSSKKLNSHPVHVSWNRNAVEGPVGVLRTDYGGGYALGATPLRDGRWHHVAVVFAPGRDEKSAVEVKQYVDGRLEGEGNPSPSGTRKPILGAPDEEAMQTNVVWLGRRLGHERQRKDRFRGKIDELFIADRALGPREIVRLMKDNEPAVADLASAGKQSTDQR